jgi:hypothetical protein
MNALTWPQPSAYNRARAGLTALRSTAQRLDARWFQILFLASFLGLGALARDFALTPLQVAFTFASALLTQAAWQWGLNLPSKKGWGGYLSALISSFGICILVRAESAWVHPLLACAAMSSKYLIRTGPAECKSHVLNPANLAAFAAWAWMPGAWLSPGQWGADSMAALWFLALGGLVTQRIQRWDVSLSFLGVWVALLACRLVVLEPRRGHVAAAGEQWRYVAVCLFHDLRPHDHSTAAQRAGGLRGDRGGGCFCLAIRAVQAAWPDRDAVHVQLGRAFV